MKLNNQSDCSKYNILSFLKKQIHYFEYKSKDYFHLSSLKITYTRTLPRQGGTGQQGLGPGF